MIKGMAANGGQGPLSPPPTGNRPLSPLGWATGSCRPLGGDRPPLFFSPGTLLQIWRRKKLHLSPVAPHRATGVYFWNFAKWTYIFEILIFFKYKKEINACFWPCACGRRPVWGYKLHGPTTHEYQPNSKTSSSEIKKTLLLSKTKIK